jgi:hypothetical protein
MYIHLLSTVHRNYVDDIEVSVDIGRVLDKEKQRRNNVHQERNRKECQGKER